MTKTSFPDDVTVYYNYEGSNINVFSSYAEMFIHTEQVDCKISTTLGCKIYDDGCSSSSFVVPAELTNDASPPYGLLAKETLPEGYSHSVCYGCFVPAGKGPDHFFVKKLKVT